MPDETAGAEVDRFAELSPQEEDEWQRLRSQLDLAEGFWLGFVFSPSPRPTDTFRRRVTERLSQAGLAMRFVAPATPEELQGAIPLLLDESAARAGCVWLECLRIDGALQDVGPWTLAWDQLLLRLNERRETVRRGLAGPLILAAPVHVKPRARDAAPDLWSIRSIVIELAPRPLPELFDGPDGGRQLLGSEGPAPDPDLAVAAAKRKGRGATAAGRDWLRAVDGFVAQGRTREAVEAGHRALESLGAAGPEKRPGRAEALAALAEAERADGDLGAAAEHMAEAIHLGEASDHPLLVKWLGDLARVESQRGAPERAVAHIRRAVDIGRRRVRQTRGRAPDRYRLAAAMVRGSAIDPAGQDRLAVARTVSSLTADHPRGRSIGGRLLTRAAQDSLRSGRLQDALAAASEAVDLLYSGDSDDRATNTILEALATLVAALIATDDLPAAEATAGDLRRRLAESPIDLDTRAQLLATVTMGVAAARPPTRERLWTLLRSAFYSIPSLLDDSDAAWVGTWVLHDMPSDVLHAVAAGDVSVLLDRLANLLEQGPPEIPPDAPGRPSER